MATMSVPKLRVDLAQTAELEELCQACKISQELCCELWQVDIPSLAVPESRQLEPGFSAEFLCHYCETKDFRSTFQCGQQRDAPVQDLEQVAYLEIQARNQTSRLAQHLKLDDFASTTSRTKHRSFLLGMLTVRPRD